MANPFLMDDDLGGMDDPTVNPFLIQSGGADTANDENPFGSESAVNPFAFGDDGDAEADAQVADIDPAMSFFGTTIEAEDDVLSIKSTADDEEDSKPKGPPPRPVPPQTQELITTVSHQMEEAGSELLGRIPATRSPSPVSMRDLHSPSPTPDSGLADLLDCSDSGSSANTQGFDVDLIGAGTNPGLVDNPFGIPTGIGNLQGAAPQAPPAKQQPPRPPPPRPAPPRPAPPSVPGQHGQPGPPPRPTPPAVLAQTNDNAAPTSEPDDLFMFDAGPPAKPPAPKTKEDILSLFDKPAAQPAAKPDLMSDDLVLDPTAAEPEPTASQEPSDETVDDPIFNSVLTRPDESTHNITSEPQSAHPPHGANNRIAPQELSNKQRAPTPDIEITTVEDLPRSDDEEEPEPPAQEKQTTEEPEPEPEPQPKVEPLREVPALVIETEPTPPADDEDEDKSIVPKSGDSDQSPPTESASHVGGDSPVEGAMSDIAASDITGHENMIEDMDTGLDFAPPSGTASANPFASPDAEEETFPPAGMVTNIFAADDTGVAENIFTTMADTIATSAAENIFTSMADTATVSVAENIFTSMTDTAAVAENIFTSMADTTAAENIFTSMADETIAYSTAENIFTSMADTVTTTAAENIFTSMADTAPVPAAAINIFSADPEPEVDTAQSAYGTNIFAEPDEFDAFAAKFESVKKDNISILDGFGGGSGVSGGSGAVTPTVDAWGDSAFGTPKSGVDAFGDSADGFGAEDDEFYAMKAPVRSDSVESVEKDFNVVIRPKTEGASAVAPQLAPPPPTRAAPAGQYDDTSAAVNPFEDSGFPAPGEVDPSLKRTDSQDTPQTPLFDEDVSQPLEDFPRLHYVGPGWEMQLRQPNKKKITGQRFWKKIFVRLVIQNDVPVVQLLNTANDKQPFQELPLQPSYSVSEIGAQQYDQFGKIFTMKLQYIFYKERPGVRPGQVTKAERITNKLTKFAQYAIAGDYEGVKEFGSDLKKLGLPVEHAPQSSQLFKVGSMNYEDMKQFSICIEEALFRLPALRERALTYKMEEVQVTAVDEIVVEQDIDGKIVKQIARVRVFFLAFLTGMPMIELGVNDMWRQGKEVVGRHDIIPVATEEWIRLEAVEFHSVVDQEEYEKSRLIRFQPPDANYIELLRFRVRPPKNRELPLQLKAQWIVTGNKVELRADILVPGFTSRKLGQIPCEDVSVRFPIPECWIYLFRVEKHFRYGSVKSAHRRTGKIKGIERILGAVDTLQESLIEVTSGQAKYEHHHRAIVWRCPRLPKEGQGAYTTHQLVCRMALTSYDQIPSELAPYAFVEFTMPATQVSHTTIRSVSVQESESDEPPEKYVRYLARHEYKVGIETTHGESTNAYLAATRPIREEPAEKPAASPVPPPSDSDSDSN